jgi:hypothetical protein
MDLSDFIRLARVVEDSFRNRGFARINVGHDSDISILTDIFFEAHFTIAIFVL